MLLLLLASGALHAGVWDLLPGQPGYEAPALQADVALPSAMSAVGWLAEDAARPAPFDARAGIRWAHDPLVFVDGDGARTEILGDAASLDLSGAVGRGRVGLAMGTMLVIASTSDVEGPQGTALGDFRFDGRATLVDPALQPLGLAVLVRVGLPAGADSRQLGQPGRTAELAACAELHPAGFTVLGNLAVGVGPPVDLQDTRLGSGLLARAAVGRDLGPRLGASVEVQARGSFGAASAESRDTPVELVGGLSRRSESGTTVALFGGFGLSPGIGAPAARLVLQVGRAPPASDMAGDAS